MGLHDVRISGSTIVLSGEIDLSAVADVERSIAPLVESAPEIVVFDLREVDFLDSSGLRVILRADKEQRAGGRRVVVVRGGRRVARVFELTGADRQLEMVDDPAEI